MTPETGITRTMGRRRRGCGNHLVSSLHVDVNLVDGMELTYRVSDPGVPNLPRPNSFLSRENISVVWRLKNVEIKIQYGQSQ
jgi:hypothetical protein